MTTTTITLAARRIVRRSAGAHANCPVEVIDGECAPTIRGESYHWETRGGRRIYYPSAYSRCGWSNMVYVSSTIRVEVGRETLVRMLGLTLAPAAAA